MRFRCPYPWLVASALAFLLVVLSSGRSAPERIEAPSYTKHIRPFLSKYCYECHQEGEAKEGIDVTSLKKLIEGTGKKKKGIVVPGNPDRSKMVKVLEGKEKLMPPKKYKNKPTADEIRLVRQWIANGAK